MNSWIKADHDFGVPWVRLVVSMRNAVIQGWMNDLDKFTHPATMARFLESVIPTMRPDLRDCQVWGINCGRQPVTLTIDMSHPSLPRVGRFEIPPEQWLEPCAVCKRPMNVGDMQWSNAKAKLFAVNTHDVCCSEDCAKALVQVDFCNWCSDPNYPDPQHHPNGQAEHVPSVCDYCGHAMAHKAADPWHEGTICKVCANSLGADAKPLPKMIVGCDPVADDPVKAGQQLVTRRHAFRCCKCGKLRLMRECATKDSPELKCKTCTSHRLEHEEMRDPGDAVI